MNIKDYTHTVGQYNDYLNELGKTNFGNVLNKNAFSEKYKEYNINKTIAIAFHRLNF